MQQSHKNLITDHTFGNAPIQDPFDYVRSKRYPPTAAEILLDVITGALLRPKTFEILCSYQSEGAKETSEKFGISKQAVIQDFERNKEKLRGAVVFLREDILKGIRKFESFALRGKNIFMVLTTLYEDVYKKVWPTMQKENAKKGEYFVAFLTLNFVDSVFTAIADGIWPEGAKITQEKFKYIGWQVCISKFYLLNYLKYKDIFSILEKRCEQQINLDEKYEEDEDEEVAFDIDDLFVEDSKVEKKFSGFRTIRDRDLKDETLPNNLKKLSEQWPKECSECKDKSCLESGKVCKPLEEHWKRIQTLLPPSELEGLK